MTNLNLSNPTFNPLTPTPWNGKLDFCTFQGLCWNDTMLEKKRRQCFSLVHGYLSVRDQFTLFFFCVAVDVIYLRDDNLPACIWTMICHYKDLYE